MLKKIIEQVIGEIAQESAPQAQAPLPPPEAAKSAAPQAPQVEDPDACLPDITEIDIREQYLVEHPEHGEEYAELKLNAPCRLGIGKAGARYKTLPQLQVRAAHSAAQDAVFSDVDDAFIESQGLFIVQTRCDSKDTYLTRPDLGG